MPLSGLNNSARNTPSQYATSRSKVDGHILEWIAPAMRLIRWSGAHNPSAERYFERLPHGNVKDVEQNAAKALADRDNSIVVIRAPSGSAPLLPTG
jgi:hypothetical protein